MTFKEQVYTRCKEVLNSKIVEIKNTLNDLKESASNETKSTAGDKHETALAMLQIEQENANKQLEHLLSQKLVLERIDPQITPTKVVTGALLKSNKGYLFLSIALGKILVEGVTVIVLSPQSPLGIKLTGLQVGQSATVNGNSYSIENIE